MAPNYVYDSEGVETIHMTADDVAAGGITMDFDAFGDPIDHLDPNGNYRIRGSCIEEAIRELGEAL